MVLTARLKTFLVVLLTAVSVCIGVANILDRLNWRRASDGITWTETTEGLTVSEVSEAVSRLSPDVASGLILLSVNGIPVGGIDDLTEVREFLADSLAGSSAEYLFQDAENQLYEVPLVISFQSGLSAIDILLAGVACVYLFIGLFIFLRSWSASGAFHFYLMCLVSSILLSFRHSGRADSFDITVYVFDVLAFVLIPPLFLHFCVIFPKNDRWLRSTALLYTPSVFLGTIFLLWLAGWLQPLGLPRIPSIDQLQQRIQLLHFVLFFLAGAAILAYKGYRTGSPWQKQQLKWISGGAVLGTVPLTIVYVLPHLLGWRIQPWMEVSVLSLVFIPLSFGYAITRYRLMDVDLIFKRSAAYVLASSILLSVYVGLVVIIGRGLQHLAPDSGFLLFALSALAVSFLFAPLNRRVQEQIDRYFYKDQYDYRRSFIEFSRTLQSEVDLNRLCNRISSRIKKTLGFERVGIFLRNHPTGAFHLHELDGRGFTSLPEFEIEISEQALIPQDAFSATVELEVEDGSQLRSTLQEAGFDHVQPLKARERTIGFIAVGSSRRGHLTTTEDLQLLEILAGYASIAIDNAMAYGSLEANAAELAELKAYSENVIESITVGVAVVSADGQITIWNSQMEGILGLKRESCVGKSISEVFPESLLVTLRQFLRGPSWSIQEPLHIHKTHITNASGESRMVAINLAPFLSSLNMNRGTLLVLEDITDKVQLESQLLQAERLSSIGLFAAGVAHEVNTPLAGISSYTQMLIKKATPHDPDLEFLKRIEQQSFRASSIINNLLSFARVSDSDIEKINLNSLTLEALSLLEHPFRKARIQVNLDLDPGLPATLGNGGKLQQVFMNLFMNAKDAMPEGGNLTISTSARDSFLVVRIQDNGVGISEEHIRKIYDPFFTTKDVGKGTGLGLSISYGIIQEHSGRIHVESKTGQGTTFTIELPLRRVH